MNSTREWDWMEENKTIKDQAKVIKELWSELQTIKRILIDDYPTTWKEIQNKL
jgi:hypothetical protein|tara:strand:+ start:41 stop:199 length:159 start_codon:yes stop_codon:yes gene_type:complete